MPSPVDVHKKNSYADAVLMRAQQRQSKLWKTTLHDEVTGEKRLWNVYGTLTPIEVTERMQQNTPIEIVRTRRAVVRKKFELTAWFDPSEEKDMMQAMSPDSQYIDTVVSAFNRKIDSEILAAAVGTAQTGKEGATSVAYDVGQDFDPGATAALTLPSLAELYLKLEEDDAINDDTIVWCIAHPKFKKQLLASADATVKIASSDYADVKALVQNKITFFMGMNFVWTTLASTNSILAYTNDCMVSGIQNTPEVHVDPRIDRQHGTQLATYLYTASARLHEDKIARVTDLA